MQEWIAALWRDELPYVLAGAGLLALLLGRRLPAVRATLRRSLLLIAALLLVDGLAGVAVVRQHPAVGAAVHEAAVLGIGWILIRLGGMACFRVLLPAMRMPVPGIVEDIVVIAGYLLWAMVRLSHAGVELTSLVATSAVITAVVAFAMQDTLGNILGGLALQFDDSLQIGDWVRIDDVSGRVIEIHWRFTALLTRNGERVVIPNSQLMKGKFTVLCDRALGVAGWRRWVGFDIDYNVRPAQVIAAAESAVADAEIANVARQPAPSCVVMAFEPGAVRYALRYWLLDPQDDDATDSAVRTHLLAAVQRNGWRMAAPDQTVHLVQEDERHRAQVRQRDLTRRLTALASSELFGSLDEGERLRIAERLVHAPFARGDVITHQGATAHWLYIVVSGEAEVVLEAPGGVRRPVTRLLPGSIFGEMGLMTGEPRSATVVAATDVECYRLDKAGFEDVLRERPSLAEGIAQILARRQAQNDALRSEHPPVAGPDRPGGHSSAILRRMRAFFGLD